MSSVSGTDRSSQNDEIRRLREDYENQEAESTKRKDREVKNLNQKHDEELKEAKNIFDNQLDSIRAKNREVLDDRDRIHNDDVSRVRELYLDSLRRKTNDDSRNRDELKSTYESEIKNEKKASDGQRKDLVRNFENNVREIERQGSDHDHRSEVTLQRDLEERTTKLNKKHAEEVSALDEDRARIRGEMGNTIAEMKAAERENKLIADRQRRYENDRKDGALYEGLTNQARTQESLNENRDKLLKEEIITLRERSSDHIKANDDLMKKNRDMYADEVGSRADSQLKRVKSDLADAQNRNTLDAITNHRLRDIDHKHLVHDYQSRENDLIRQRDGIYAEVNEQGRERMGRVIDKTEKLIGDTNRKHRSEQNIESLKTKEALSNAEILRKDQLGLANYRADARVNKVQKANQQSQKEIQDESLRGHEELKKYYGDNLENMREQNLESMNKIYTRMDQRMRDFEMNALKKHDDTVDFYENKISDIENQKKIDMQKQAQLFEGRIAAREKGVKTEEDAIEMKYQGKMAAADEIHRKEIDRLEKRHQEQMQALAGRVNANQRKA